MDIKTKQTELKIKKRRNYDTFKMLFLEIVEKNYEKFKRRQATKIVRIKKGMRRYIG